MRFFVAFRSGLAVLALSLVACSSAPTDPASPPPQPGTIQRWSAPATWPAGVLPGPGAAVTIPAGRTVLLDISPPALASLTVEGTLQFDATRDLELTAGWIAVHGALEIGSEAQPFTRRAVITLTGRWLKAA